MEDQVLTAHELEPIATIVLPTSHARTPSVEQGTKLGVLGDFLFRDRLVRVLRAVFDDHPVAYRLDVLRETQSGLVQACAVEALPSPAECALLYVCGSEGARVEIVRDSHELAEFSEAGHSRWSPQGISAVRDIVAAQSGSIDVVDLVPEDMLLVGPGTIHRLVTQESCPVLRVLVAPRRVTPTRFLSGEGSWLESTHVSGAKLRL